MDTISKYRLLKILTILTVLMTLGSCYAPKMTKIVSFNSINNNVCKKLNGNVIIYAIFVDSKYTNPWSEYDIKSTLDSINTAINWIEQKAGFDSIYLDIELDYHESKQGIVPIKNNFSKKTLHSTLYKKPLWSGVKDIYRWADKIAKEAGKSLPPDTSGMTNIKNDLKDRERLIARIRDIHRTDKVALMYFINNYYSDEISLTLDIHNDQNIEFSIVSFKNPSVIAHEFLHIFGAYDLYITPFDTKRKDKKKKSDLMELFPNEIMAYAYRDINKLEISEFTKYLIGWKNELSQKHQKMLLGKGYFTVKY